MAGWLALLGPSSIHAEAAQGLVQGGILLFGEVLLGWLRALGVGSLAVVSLLLVYGIWRSHVDPAPTRRA